MKHIMLDIETLATAQKAVVVSLGAVAFDPHSEELGERFYVEFADLAFQQQMGRILDADTVSWWMRQSDEAKQLFVEKESPERLNTATALVAFGHFIARNGGKNAEIWGNGSDFDNVIVGSLYDDFCMPKPWSYSRNRCYRTMRACFGADVPRTRHGVHHNGLDDAITQAIHLQGIFACLKSQS